MKTIEIQLFKFTELSETAKNTAIEKYKENDYIYLEFFNDDCHEQIRENGFRGNINIQYSLSYSQGDGLSFSCDYFNNLNELFIEVLGNGKQKTIECIINNLSFKCTGNKGHYCYASRSDISLELDNYYVKSSTNLDDVISKVENKLKDLYMNLCKKLENQGYKEIEYQYSDEYIINELIENDYDFTTGGYIY